MTVKCCVYLEARLAAGDHVELVVDELQRPVGPDRDGDAPLVGVRLQSIHFHEYE